jgi:hypothetical protein
VSGFCISCLNAGIHGAMHDDVRPEDTVPGREHCRFCVCTKGRRKKRESERKVARRTAKGEG